MKEKDYRTLKEKQRAAQHEKICSLYTTLVNYAQKTKQHVTCGRLLELVQQEMGKKGIYYTTVGIRRILVDNGIYLSKGELYERQNRQNAC